MSSIEKAINKLGKKDEFKSSAAKIPDSSAERTVIPNDRPTENTVAAARSISIDFSALGAMGFLTPDDNASSIAQELRIIKRPILTNASRGIGRKNSRSNLLVVTSALPGEGKTFSAINLAISIAMEVDRSVLLVDADNARAGISAALGFDASQGLSDLLKDHSLAINDVLIETNMPNLSLLSAGTQVPNMTELLASEAMENLVADMSNNNPDRIVIFDSSPITITTEARVLASLVGQVLLVVEANGTPQQVVKDAVESIGSEKEVGIMLNKTLSSNVAGYGYEYGYGSRS